jgi:hypothetical protein
MRKLLVVAGAVCAFSTTAPAALAANLTGNQLVGATTGSSLALGVSTPAVTLGSFAPGSTASGSGALVVTSTNPWTLSAADGAGNAGHLTAAAVGCTGSEASTANALVVDTVGGSGSTASTGPVTLSGSSVNVANGLFADVVTANYSLVLGNTESLLTGCAYTTTVTYTVQ